MHNRKLTLGHLERGHSRKVFLHLQNAAGLQEHGRERVDEAMKATIAHVQKKRDLQFGMTEKHVDTALSFLKNHYEGRKLLKPKEREVIKHSLDLFFDKKPEESRVEKLERVEKETVPAAKIESAPTRIEPGPLEISPRPQ